MPTVKTARLLNIYIFIFVRKVVPRNVPISLPTVPFSPHSQKPNFPPTVPSSSIQAPSQTQISKHLALPGKAIYRGLLTAWSVRPVQVGFQRDQRWACSAKVSRGANPVAAFPAKPPKPSPQQYRLPCPKSRLDAVAPGYASGPRACYPKSEGFS